MAERVHILATVRRPELLPAATLVFGSLRVGFPTHPVVVHGNGLDPESERVVQACANRVGAQYLPLPSTCHDGWIEGLIARETEPFWVVDTDVVFWSRMPSAVAGRPLFMGRFEPEFDEEFTRTRHMARLHTCVMWINAWELRAAMRCWMARVPVPWRFTAEFPLVRQNFVPVLRGVSTSGERGWVQTLFYDSMGGAFHALGGRAFTPEVDACFDHLHCATYADEVGLALGGRDLKAAHQKIFEDPSQARGIKASQDRYYESRKPKEPLCPVIRE